MFEKIDKDILTISFEVKNEEHKEDDGYTRREICFFFLQKSFLMFTETISMDKN